ncbi:hypothetical protein CH063_10754 [Colletotrichum higginsianum]|uniref:Uncharacterized protein n=1 Tax=Colletotrichum higginsianum (strain IMI 349063) TaxID=759273 RepID=H1VIN9_COLHI|nr:hypothetical protein CH063_10754 [Colletotrichum higginsianum]
MALKSFDQFNPAFPALRNMFAPSETVSRRRLVQCRRPGDVIGNRAHLNLFFSKPQHNLTHAAYPKRALFTYFDTSHWTMCRPPAMPSHPWPTTERRKKKGLGPVCWSVPAATGTFCHDFPAFVFLVHRSLAYWATLPSSPRCDHDDDDDADDADDDDKPPGPRNTFSNVASYPLSTSTRKPTLRSPATKYESARVVVSTKENRIRHVPCPPWTSCVTSPLSTD